MAGQGLVPEIVGPEPTVTGVADQRDADDEMFGVDPEVAQLREGSGIGRAENRQGEQGPAVVLAEPAQHLLPHEAPAGSCRRGQRQTHERRPACECGHRPVVVTRVDGQDVDLVRGEGEVVLGDLEQPVGGLEPGQGESDLTPAGEHEVGVRGKQPHEVGDESHPGRAVRQLVQVVDHQADGYRRGQTQPRGDGAGPAGAHGGDVDRPQDRAGELVCVLVARLA